jgi:hypothetical protein
MIMLITCLRDRVVGIQNLNLNSKFSIFVKCGPLSSVGNFSKLIRFELDHTPKRESVPKTLFYKSANLQKFLSSGVICFKGPKRAP